MKISQFCLRLKNHFSCEFMYCDPDQELYTFKPVANMAVFDKNTLYISSCPHPELAIPEVPVNMLIYAEGIFQSLSSLREYYPFANVICVDRGPHSSMDFLYDMVSDIFLDENRYTSAVNRLSHIFSSNGGMQALIDDASRFLDGPIVVIDSSYQLLATSCQDLLVDETGLEEQKRIGTLTQRNLERLRRDKIFELIRKNPERMFFSKAPDAQHWWMNMLVYVHGIEVAEVGIMEYRRKFSAYDMELMAYLRHLISLEIQRGNFFSKNYSVAHNLLTADLLNRDYPAAEVMIRHRTALLGWRTAKFYSVLTVFPADGYSDKKFFRQGELLASQMSQLISDAHWRVGEKDIAFLIFHDRRYLEDRLENQKLNELLRINHMIGILGNPVSSLIDVGKSYEQCLALYKVREHLPEEETVARYSDHSILHIGSILYQSQAIEGFFHPYVLMIRDYDQENHTDYLNTLYEYLTFIDDPNTIAKHLHIHKNTLYYRKNKLQELFPIDLNNGNTRLYLQLTMKMMKFGGE